MTAFQIPRRGQRTSSRTVTRLTKSTFATIKTASCFHGHERTTATAIRSSTTISSLPFPVGYDLTFEAAKVGDFQEDCEHSSARRQVLLCRRSSTAAAIAGCHFSQQSRAQDVYDSRFPEPGRERFGALLFEAQLASEVSRKRSLHSSVKSPRAVDRQNQARRHEFELAGRTQTRHQAVCRTSLRNKAQ